MDSTLRYTSVCIANIYIIFNTMQYIVYFFEINAIFLPISTPALTGSRQKPFLKNYTPHANN